MVKKGYYRNESLGSYESVPGCCIYNYSDNRISFEEYFPEKVLQNKTGRLISDRSFLKTALYEVKACGQHLSFNIFW